MPDISPNSLFQDALRLSYQQRATLAAMLIDSLDANVDDEVESAWAHEVQRRID